MRVCLNIAITHTVLVIHSIIITTPLLAFILMCRLLLLIHTISGQSSSPGRNFPQQHADHGRAVQIAGFRATGRNRTLKRIPRTAC